MNNATAIPCAVSADLSLYLDQLERQANQSQTNLAKTQLAKVEDLARKFSSGFSFTTQSADGQKLTYSMRDVADRFSESISPELCASILHGDQSSLTKAQEQILQASLEIAFEALGLESAPFLDYNDLESEANGDF